MCVGRRQGRLGWQLVFKGTMPRFYGLLFSQNYPILAPWQQQQVAKLFNSSSKSLTSCLGSNSVWLNISLSCLKFKFEKSDFLVSKTLELSKNSNYCSRPHNQNRKYFKSLPRVPDRLNWQKKTELASLFGTVPLKKTQLFFTHQRRGQGPGRPGQATEHPSCLQ